MIQYGFLRFLFSPFILQVLLLCTFLAVASCNPVDYGGYSAIHAAPAYVHAAPIHKVIAEPVVSINT